MINIEQIRENSRDSKIDVMEKEITQTTEKLNKEERSEEILKTKSPDEDDDRLRIPAQSKFSKGSSF
jgi:hypothetical protein